MKRIFMFSGQGSHYFQMGHALYERAPAFRRWMTRLDEVVRDEAGYSVVAALYDKRNLKSDTFDDTRLTHPAIFMVEFALARHLIESGVEPDLTLGASLGMFAAVAVAGCVAPEDALLAVVRQVSAFDACCAKGGMIAVLADRSQFEQCGLDRYGEVAAENFDSHFVISAPAPNLPVLEEALRARQMTFQKLAVGFAYHSRWIDGARATFEERMKSLQTRLPGAAQIPIACCARAQVLKDLNGHGMWPVVREKIRFAQTLRVLEASGPHQLIDLGPSGTLATFARYALPAGSRSRAFPTLTPFGRDFENLAAIPM